MTQEDMILEHLKEFGTITSWDAIMEYGITRLSDKIYKLRKMGYIITSEVISKRNRYNVITHFNKYKLEENK